MEIAEKKNTIIKMLKLVDKLNSWMVKLDNTLSEPEDKSLEFTQSEQRKNRLQKWTDYRSLWDTKRSNIYIIRVPKEGR